MNPEDQSMFNAANDKHERQESETPKTDKWMLSTTDFVNTAIPFARQLERELTALRKENEELKDSLRLIGDIAVVDFDDAVVGKVDAVVKQPAPQRYIDRVRAMLKRDKENLQTIAERDFLRKDKERLDWLEHDQNLLDFQKRLSIPMKDWNKELWGVRTAIDDAMRKETSKF